MTNLKTPLEALELVVPELEDKEYMARMIEEEKVSSFDALWEII